MNMNNNKVIYLKDKERVFTLKELQKKLQYDF